MPILSFSATRPGFSGGLKADTVQFSGQRKVGAAELARLTSTPTVTEHEGVQVVRDDLLPGGTKARFLYKLFEQYPEVVYPSCTWGGAQVALAYGAKMTGKKATLLVPKRQQLHPRTLQAISIAGADVKDFKPGTGGQMVLDSPHLKVIQVPHGFLTVLRARAVEYCKGNPKAHFLEIGAKSEFAEAEIAAAAAKVEAEQGPFDEVWCAAGSGTLARGLQQGFSHPGTQFFAIEVAQPTQNVGKAKVIRHPNKLEKPIKDAPPFPSCPHYDAKAWQVCKDRHGRGKRVLFWNVMGGL